MASSKRKTTFAKLARERKLIERRLEKKAKKEARKHSAAPPAVPASDSPPAATDQTARPTVEQAAPEAVVPPSRDA
jgi:hypothetical protein